MNQHFNKKNIEAAVRTAMTNVNQIVFVNGPRSNNRYSVAYDKDSRKIFFMSKNSAQCGYVDVSKLTKSQTSKNDKVASIVEYFTQCIAA